MLNEKKEFNKFCLYLTFGAMVIALNSALADQFTSNGGGMVFFAEVAVYVAFLVVWNRRLACNNQVET